jgi:hypothetical protein
MADETVGDPSVYDNYVAIRIIFELAAPHSAISNANQVAQGWDSRVRDIDSKGGPSTRSDRCDIIVAYRRIGVSFVAVSRSGSRGRQFADIRTPGTPAMFGAHVVFVAHVDV